MQNWVIDCYGNKEVQARMAVVSLTAIRLYLAATNSGNNLSGIGLSESGSIYNQILSNMVENNDQGGYGNSGIKVLTNYNTMNANTCRDTQATKTQDYGIQTTGSADYNTITNNDLRYNQLGGLSTVGSNNTISGNLQ